MENNFKPIALTTLREKALLASLHFSGLGTSFVNKAVTDQTLSDNGAADKMGRFNQKRIVGPEISKIQAIIREAKRVFREATMPWDKEASLLPSAGYLPLSQQISAAEVELSGAKTALVQNWDTVKKFTKLKLGKLFDEKKFPTVQEIEEISLEFAIAPLANPADFRVAVSEEEVARLTAQLEAAAAAKQKWAIQHELASLKDEFDKLLSCSKKGEIKKKTITNVEKALARSESKFKLWGEGQAQDLTDAKEVFSIVADSAPKDLNKQPELVQAITDKIMARFK